MFRFPWSRFGLIQILSEESVMTDPSYRERLDPTRARRKRFWAFIFMCLVWLAGKVGWPATILIAIGVAAAAAALFVIGSCAGRQCF